MKPKLNAKTRRILKRELRDIEAGKNLSPAFENVYEAVSYLRNVCAEKKVYRPHRRPHGEK